jgi:PAS domain S-box-containing protein
MGQQQTGAVIGTEEASGISADESRLPLAELKQLYDTAPVALGFVDTELRYVRLNERLAAINGRPVDEHLGRTIHEIVPQLAATLEPIYRRVFATGEPALNIEVHGSTPAAADRDFLVSYYPVRAGDGTLQGVSLVVQDITERKRAEAALRTREEEERLFSDQLTSLHEVTNQLSTLESVDELCRAAVQLGRSRLGFDRLGIWLVDPQDPTTATGTFGVDEQGQIRDERSSRVTVFPSSVAGQVLASRRPFFLRERVPVLDDRAEPVGRGAHAIAGLWNGEEVIGFVSTDNLLENRPITERQCKLLSLYASALGHLYAVKRLEHALRLRAQELAEADRRKDEFLAMLAHELRNPLAPILNAVQMMRLRGPDDPHQRRSQDVVERQVRHMARLVNDLLDVSRITQGKIGLKKESVELASVVRATVEMVRTLLDARGHELIVSVPSEPVHLDADPTRLEQVLSNLLNNAAKYTERGGRIWLTAEQDRDEAVVRVRDTGVGISAELLPHVFDLFTQADCSLVRSQGGLGIGLTMVQRLVELHGGRVEVFSAGPGQGSEFVVHLPALPAAQPPSAEENHRVVEQLSPARRVLVVDDNVDAAETLAEVLDLWGHEVRVVHDGLAAIEEASRYKPSVVLLDIGLPGVNGCEVARRLREQPALRDSVLIAVTGYGREWRADRRIGPEFDHHMVKPVDLSVLEALLASLAEPPAVE